MALPIDPRDTNRHGSQVLLVWPGVPAWRIAGKIWLDRKFKDGMDAWARQWPGRLRAVMEVTQLAAVPSFGAYPWSAGDECFDLELIQPGEAFSGKHLAGVDLLMANADSPSKLSAPGLCRIAGVACVLSIEYTLATRLDMLTYSRMSPFKRLKTFAWLVVNEWRIRSAMRQCDSVQANGIPAFDIYGKSKPGSHLYFDTRLNADAVIDADALESRLNRLASDGPLRLAFSGRLIGGKGADALVPLAARLQKLGLNFHLDIYGSGELESEIGASILAEGLSDIVTLHGPIDFDSALVPMLRETIDLFVCCHRQGDPSCTYAETLGCGVPIVGFRNESLSSLVNRFDIGWCVPMNALDALAALILRLDRGRSEIAAKARSARRFGLANSFEKTFEERVNHCLAVLARVPGSTDGRELQAAADAGD